MSDVRTYEFEAVIREAPRGGAWIVIPFDAKEAFGSGRPKIVATFDGEPYRGSIASMGGEYVLGVAKAIRAAIGKAPGATIAVTIVADDEPRTVDVPPDLAAALDAAGVRDAFDGLSYTRRREQVQSITGAKKPATRGRRIARAVEMLEG